MNSKFFLFESLNYEYYLNSEKSNRKQKKKRKSKGKKKRQRPGVGGPRSGPDPRPSPLRRQRRRHRGRALPRRRGGRRRRTTALRDARLGVLDARVRGWPGSGGAAPVGSPERPRRWRDAAEDRTDGGDESGAAAPSRRPICGEGGDPAAANLAVGLGLDGEARCGGAARRRRRRGPDRAGREEKELFHRGPSIFSHRDPRSFRKLQKSPSAEHCRSASTIDCGPPIADRTAENNQGDVAVSVGG